MTVLKQGLIYKYAGKGKWIDAWFILYSDDDGPQFAIFKDSSARKPLEATIALKNVTEKLRFGYTTRQFSERVDLTKKDVRIDESAFIAVMIEKVVKKVTKAETIWLCATTIVEMFDLIKLTARCLTAANMNAPDSNDLEEMDSLHRYSPLSFQPENDWEKYYDSPPRQLLIVPLTAGITRSASVDVIAEKKTMKEVKNKNLKKQKEDSKSLSALNEIPATRRSSTSLASSSSKQSIKVAAASVFIVQEDPYAPMQVLYRAQEAFEKPPLAPKPSFRQPHPKSVSSVSDVSTLQAPSPVPSERKSVRSETVATPLPQPVIRGRTCDVEVQTDECRLSSPAPTPTPPPPRHRNTIIVPVNYTEPLRNKENFDPSILRRDAEYNETKGFQNLEKSVGDLREVSKPALPKQQSPRLSTTSLTSSIDDFEDAFSRTESLYYEQRRGFADLDCELSEECAYYSKETRMYTVEISPQNI